MGAANRRELVLEGLHLKFLEQYRGMSNMELDGQAEEHNFAVGRVDSEVLENVAQDLFILI